MENIVFNETNTYNLIQGIAKQAVADYRNAIRLLSKCRSHQCRSCRKPLGKPCEAALENVKDFFNGNIFHLAYPNIDGAYMLRQTEKMSKKYFSNKGKRE